MPFELPLTLDFFFGQLRDRQLKPPNEAQIDFHLLHPVTVDLFRCVDDNFLHELVDHGRGQLGKIGVLPCQLQKLLHTGGVLCENGQPFFRFCDRNLQRFLLGFVICQQTVKAFAGNTPDSKGFIELLDDGIQLRNPLFLLVQPPLGFLDRFCLPQLGGGAHLLQKSVPVGDGKGAGSPDGFQNQLPQHLAADIVSAASMGAFLMCQRIGGTIVKVRRIRIVLRAAP